MLGTSEAHDHTASRLAVCQLVLGTDVTVVTLSHTDAGREHLQMTQSALYCLQAPTQCSVTRPFDALGRSQATSARSLLHKAISLMSWKPVADSFVE